MESVWMNSQAVHCMHSIFGSAYTSWWRKVMKWTLKLATAFALTRGSLCKFHLLCWWRTCRVILQTATILSKHVLKFLFVICDLAGSERRHFPQAVCDQLHHQEPHLWQGCQECFFCWWQQDAGAEAQEKCPAVPHTWWTWSWWRGSCKEEKVCGDSGGGGCAWNYGFLAVPQQKVTAVRCDGEAGAKDAGCCLQIPAARLLGRDFFQISQKVWGFCQGQAEGRLRAELKKWYENVVVSAKKLAWLKYDSVCLKSISPRGSDPTAVFCYSLHGCT